MALERLPLVINGIDFSAAANRTAYEVEDEERTGDNGFLSLAGTIDIDLLRTAQNVYWPLNALWTDELAQLRQAVKSSIFVPVSYFDLDYNEARSGYFHGSFARFFVPYVTSRGRMVKDGSVLVLRMR